MTKIETSPNFYPKDFFLEAQISQFFDLRAERRFLDKLKREQVEERQIAFYSREQVMKFLFEFAAGVKKTHITYELDNQGRIVYPGIGLEMENMLYEAAAKQGINGDNRRELAELGGWQKMQQLFGHKGANHVLQLSPPDNTNLQHGNYGFLFWFQRQGNRVINHILRYDEDYKRLTQSRYLASVLEIPISSQKNVANQCLLDPKGFQTNTLAMHDLLQALGFSLDNRSSLLEQALFSDKAFLTLLAQYQQILDEPSRSAFKEDQVLAILSQLYQLTQVKATQIGLLNARPQEMHLPLIFQGGSCPVIGSNGFGFYDFSAYLWGEPFKCPNCGYVSYVPVGNQCKNCKITKAEWKKKQEEEKGDSFNVCD